MGLARGGGTALAAVVFIPLMFLAWTAFVRIVLEIFIVVFRIAEPVREAASSLDELRRLTQQDADRLTRAPDSGADAASASTSQASAESTTDTGDGGEDNPPPHSGSSPAGTDHPHAIQRFCVKCGEKNKPEFKFCFSCGADLA